MQKKIFLAAMVALTVGLVSCNGEKGYEDAVVVNTTSINGYSCGYLLRLNDSSLLKPNNLPSAYMHEGMPVKIKYDFSGNKDTCDYGPKIYDLVYIREISNRYK